jgi:L-ascorbate metabolism protein UlaG (beta-lactamase superfamily)
MDIQWFGQSCVKIKSKKATIIIDPYDANFTGLKKLKLSGDILTISHDHEDHNAREVVDGDPVVLWGPGEYEVKGVRIKGILSFHDNKQGKERGRNTIFVFNVEDVSVCHLGDLGHILTSEQLEAIGAVDVLCVPVGGVYTIDGVEAVQVIAQLEPKIIIPMHYALPDLKFDLHEVEEFLKAYGQHRPDVLSKLSISADKMPEVTQVVLLEKSN